MHNVPAHSLREKIESISETVVDTLHTIQPEMWKPYGQPGREKSVRDVGYHLTYLAEALEANDPQLFSEYLAWVKILFANLKFPDFVLLTTLEATRKVLAKNLAGETQSRALQFLDDGIASLAGAPGVIDSYLIGDAPLDVLARQFLDTLLRNDRRSASQLILNAVESGIAIKDIYLYVFQRTQHEIGRLWQTNQINVAQEHFCTAATQLVMSQLYPYLFTGERKDRRLVVSCIGGELHEIGARMVADFFEMDGWDTYFLGANTPSESILHTIKDREAHVLAVSATMTFHINKVKNLIADLRASQVAQTRVLAGGYPFNLSTDLWRYVGADGYAQDALSAVAEAEKLMMT